MNPTRAKMIKEMESKISRLQRAVADLDLFPIELITQVFPEAEIQWWWDTDIEITLPMRWSLIEEVKMFMQEQFPSAKLYCDHQVVWDDSKSAGYFLNWHLPTEIPHDYIPIKFGFRSNKSGSTCVLNQIGTKEVPVFEAVCQDGAEEGAFE